MWECYPIIIYIIYPMYCYNNILERRKLYVSVLRDPFVLLHVWALPTERKLAEDAAPVGAERDMSLNPVALCECRSSGLGDYRFSGSLLQCGIHNNTKLLPKSSSEQALKLFPFN